MPYVQTSLPDYLAKVTTGVPATVATHAALQAVSAFWPDGTIGSVALGGPNVQWYGETTTTLNNPLKVRGTLAAPISGGGATAIVVAGMPGTYEYHAGGPVYFDQPTGVTLMGLHLEKWPGGDATKFWASFALAYSLDAGATWTYLDVILQPNKPYSDSATVAVEIGSGPFVILNGYIYVYYSDTLTDGTHVWFAVARARLADLIAWARGGPMARFSKYYQGAWNEFGRGANFDGGGLSSPLEVGNPQLSWVAVNYQVDRDLVLAAVTNSRSIYLIQSRNGIAWTRRKTLVDTLVEPGENFYPSLTGGGGQRITGPAWLYNTSSVIGGFGRWGDAFLVGRTVSLSPARPRRVGYFSPRGGPAAYNPV